jgi:hypothetical protein
MALKQVLFNHDVLVEVFHVDVDLYDFKIYADINRQNVSSDFDSYREVLSQLDIPPIGLYTREEIGDVLKKIENLTDERD